MALMQALEGHITAPAAASCSTRRSAGSRARWRLFRIETQSGRRDDGSFTARNLVLAGGLGATALGRMLTYPGRLRRAGNLSRARTLLSRSTGRAPFRHLVYPMPTRRLARRAPDARRRRPRHASAPTSNGATAASYAFDDDGGERLRAIRERDPPLLAGPARRRAAAGLASACAPRSIARASRSPILPSTAPQQHGIAAPRRALRHGEPRAHVLARHR